MHYMCNVHVACIASVPMGACNVWLFVVVDDGGGVDVSIAFF